MRFSRSFLNLLIFFSLLLVVFFFLFLCIVFNASFITILKLKQTFFKVYLKAYENDFKWKTSDWILQEIGFASAKEMKIMLLVEEGLRNVGGIQGDLECISFKRSDPEKSFNKILEMLQTFIPKEIEPESSQRVETSRRPEEDEEVEKPDNNMLNPEENWTPKHYEYALMISINSNNNDNEEDIFNKYLQTKHIEDENEKIRWEALRFFFNEIFNKKNSLDQLKELSNKYPNHSFVHYYLGRVYEKYDQFELAAQCFQKSADYETDNEIKVRKLCNASVALANNGNKSGALSIIEEAKSIEVDPKKINKILLESMSKISEIFSNDYDFISINECLIDLKPDNYDKRFSLAYKYLNIEDYELSLYHFSKLIKQNPDEATFNNYGVSAYYLELLHKSIEAYKESEKLGGTLAMSNLAHKLIQAGFLEEADEICNRAIKIEGYDKEVGTAISKIKDTKKEEDEKEKQILENAKASRLIYSKYALACLKRTPKSLKGIWKDLKCKLDLYIDGSQFKATGSYSFEENNIYLAFLAFKDKSPIPSKLVQKTAVVEYNGEINGHGIIFEKTTKFKDATNPYNNDDVKVGFMIISDNLSEIEVYENKKTPKYSYTITKN